MDAKQKRLRSFTREYLDANLDNPNDPYGLAEDPEFVIRYLSPCYAVYGAEITRRFRLGLLESDLVNEESHA